MSGSIHFKQHGRHVAMLEFDNPPMNTMGQAMRAQFMARLDALEADEEIRAIVVTGRGRAFCSGDDLKEERVAAAKAHHSDTPPAEAVSFSQLLERIEGFRVPVVAAINGWCVGGGLEIALCCDIRIATSSARFVCAGVNVGLMASAYRLPRLIGVARAKAMLLTGTPHDAAAAERYGLVTAIQEPEELVPAALALATRISTRAPLSVEATKRMAGRALDLDAQAAASLQAEEFKVLVRTEDHAEALTAFAEKREPIFTRR
ncbi:MAG TPA: enoyl-CoA hydratase-related protein [Aliidongia sp.]|nr:enoyl-CoA hydratase-related protein [Aliidongia sp.]